VQVGDTLGGIALKFGVNLEDLQAANPQISPNTMSVGQVLRIPSDPANPSGEPTPTPAPFDVEQVQCYQSTDQGMWCFVLAHNSTSDFYENVSAQVTLLDSDGGSIASLPALLPLNILPPDASLPLAVFFPPKVAAQATPQVQILTAIRLPPGDPRYLPASTQNALVEVTWDGRDAKVTGAVVLPAGSKAAASVWIAATAYDELGQVVGFRSWEGGALPPAGGLPFSMTVSSLAGRIDRVDLAVEARP
jgi:LysM repeat protein